MVVRCTKKMLDLLGAYSGTLVELAPTDDDWYLNVLWIERRKCLLLVHSGTLFSVFRADVRSADLRLPGEYVVDAIQSELREEQLPLDTFSALAPDGVLFATTASRRTLGFMTEMAAELGDAIAQAGGLSGCDIAVLNQGLRRTLHNYDGYTTPIELVQAKRPACNVSHAADAPPITAFISMYGRARRRPQLRCDRLRRELPHRARAYRQPPARLNCSAWHVRAPVRSVPPRGQSQCPRT